MSWVVVIELDETLLVGHEIRGIPVVMKALDRLGMTPTEWIVPEQVLYDHARIVDNGPITASKFDAVRDRRRFPI